MSEFIVGKGCDNISCALCGKVMAGPEGLSETAYMAHRADCPDRPATVSTTCARCSATIDPAAVEQHHERCFRVGDEVRSTHRAGIEVDGTIVSVVAPGIFGVRIAQPTGLMKAGSTLAFGVSALRHIQRPGQAVRSCCPGATTGHVCGCDQVEARAAAYHELASEAPGPIGCAHGDDDDEELQDAMERVEPIAPTLIDGLTAMECLDAYQIYMQGDRFKWQPGERMKLDRYMTPAQLAAARDLWSQQLKQRISAAKERERLTVRIDVQDEE